MHYAQIHTRYFVKYSKLTNKNVLYYNSNISDSLLIDCVITMINENKANYTIADIARMANVSTTTVSRYINGKYQYMSAETQKLLADTIKKCGYRPSQVARSLKTKKSNIIAIVCPGVTVQSSPLFLQGVDAFLQDKDYDYVIFSSGNDFDREYKCLDRCADQMVDGILYSPSNVKFDRAAEICNHGTPVVLFDRYLEAWPYSSVYINHSGIVYSMIDQLVSLGYREIKLLCGSYTNPDTRYHREQAFLKYMSGHKGSSNIEGGILRFKRGNEMAQSISKTISKYLEEPANVPRAVFSIDMLALRTTMAIRNTLHFQIPEDFALCGYDFGDFSLVTSPVLTYIEQPLFEMGYEAAKMLIDQIESGKNHSKHTLCIEGTIHLGESTPHV